MPKKKIKEDIISKIYEMFAFNIIGFAKYEITNEEIEELQEIVYEYGNSFFPIDTFFNDIKMNKMENYDKNRAYKDFCLIMHRYIQLNNYYRNTKEGNKNE